MKSKDFTDKLSKPHLAAWEAIKDVIQNVLGKNRVHKDLMKEYVKKMMNAFKAIGSSMTLKMHFLNNHLDEFLARSSKESNEHGEQIHQVTLPKTFQREEVECNDSGFMLVEYENGLVSR